MNKRERTHLGEFLTIYGPFLFVIGSFLVARFRSWWRERVVPLGKAGSLKGGTRNG